MRACVFEPNRKIKNDTLRKFSGNIHEFQMWRDRIVDHLCRTNRQWRPILEVMQTWPTPISKEWLMTQSHGGYSGWEISEILEGFLIEWLSDSLYKRRTQLCGGTKGNGLEMWRWLFTEFQGGSDAVMLGGSRQLQDWPRCQKLDQLSQHLDDWCECLQMYGTELLNAPNVLRTVLLGVIFRSLRRSFLPNHTSRRGKKSSTGAKSRQYTDAKSYCLRLHGDLAVESVH